MSTFHQQGCTKGRHNSEKPPEPVKPEVKTTEKKELSELKPRFQEHIIQAPKPVEAIKRPRYTLYSYIPVLQLITASVPGITSYNFASYHSQPLCSSPTFEPFGFLFCSVTRFSSVAQSCPTLSDPMNCSMPGLPARHQLPESTQTHVHHVSGAIQASHPLSPPCPAFNLSQHQVFCPVCQFFASSGQSIGSLSFSISPSNEYSGLISSRMDWLALLAVQGTLKSLLQ